MGLEVRSRCLVVLLIENGRIEMSASCFQTSVLKWVW